MRQPGRMRTRMLGALALALTGSAAGAQEPASPPQQEREHVVRRGDTLWDLAGQYLANPFLWPMLYEANRSVVENPHWIYPGERLRIPGVPAVEPIAEPVQEEPGAPPSGQAAPGQAEPGPGAAAVTLDVRRPAIPPGEYYSTPWLESSPASLVAGRVLQLADEPGTARDRIAPALHPHTRIHIGELRGTPPQAGDSLLLVRLGRQVTGYGQVVAPMALVGVDSVGAGLVTGEVLVQFGEAAVGDLLFRLAPMPAIPVGRSEPVVNGPEGRLLDFLDEQQIYGTGDHGFVSMAGEALKLGDELAVYVPGSVMGGERTATAPPTQVARARVVRIAERTATVRLTGVFDTSVRPGLPVRLVARVP